MHRNEVKLPALHNARYCTAAVVLVGLWLPMVVCAQIPAPRAIPPADVVKQIGVDQNLGGQVPLDAMFRDEAGKEVRLGSYFGTRPVVLSLVYYRCPMLCTMSLNGMLAAFKPLTFDVGKEFEVVTISFDPRETSEMAAAKKRSYINQYGRAGADAGWHFLTGDQKSIEAVAQACGFRYFYDPRTDQYAHASAIMVLTPQGKLSRYFYGLEYSPRNLRLGLIEAAENRIGSVADQLMLLCYQYDPTTGKYGFAIMASIRIAATLTLMAIGTFAFVAIRRERRLRQLAAGAPADSAIGPGGCA